MRMNFEKRKKQKDALTLQWAFMTEQKFGNWLDLTYLFAQQQ